MDELEKHAKRLRLSICQHCDFPREAHVGFDHGKGKCIVTGRVSDLAGLDGRRSRREWDRVFARIREWLDIRDALQNIGEGI